MNTQDVEVGISRSEGRYLNRKDSFSGFREVDRKGASELHEHLGISLSGIRTFHYQGEPRFASVRRKLGMLDHNINNFLDSQGHRGTYDPIQDAVFVRPGDRFAEVHELGHAFGERNNDGLGEFCADGRMGAFGVEQRLVSIATEEGMSQWMAVATGLLTEDPKRVEEAMWESNRLVADEDVRDAFNYDPEAVAEKIATVKKLVADYAKSPVVQRSGNPILAQEKYEALLKNDDLYRGLMSLGYVYTMSRLAEEEPSGRKTSDVLADVIKIPPTFAEMEQGALNFSGQVDFKNLVL
jgi:hypothetical protein